MPQAVALTRVPDIPELEGRVDVWPTEEHRLELGVTDYPIESGQLLTDNAVRRKNRMTLTGVVSGIASPDGTEPGTGDRAPEVWARIRKLFEDRQIVTVVTALGVYRSMLVTGATATVDVTTGRSLKFELRLEEALFEPVPRGRLESGNVSGPAEDRTSVEERGRQPSNAPDLNRIPGNVGGRAEPVRRPGEPIDPASIQPRLPGRLEIGRASLIRSRARRNRTGALDNARAIVIPLSNEPHQTETHDLHGVDASLEVWWQPASPRGEDDQPTPIRRSDPEEAGSWYLTLDHAGLLGLLPGAIASGVRLVENGWPLLGVRHLLYGELWVSGRGHPGRNAWDTTHNLIFIPDAEE